MSHIQDNGEVYRQGPHVVMLIGPSGFWVPHLTVFLSWASLWSSVEVCFAKCEYWNLSAGEWERTVLCLHDEPNFKEPTARHEAKPKVRFKVKDKVSFKVRSSISCNSIFTSFSESRIECNKQAVDWIKGLAIPSFRLMKYDTLVPNHRISYIILFYKLLSTKITRLRGTLWLWSGALQNQLSTIMLQGRLYDALISSSEWMPTLLLPFYRIPSTYLY